MNGRVMANANLSLFLSGNITLSGSQPTTTIRVICRTSPSWGWTVTATNICYPSEQSKPLPFIKSFGHQGMV